MDGKNGWMIQTQVRRILLFLLNKQWCQCAYVARINVLHPTSICQLRSSGSCQTQNIFLCVSMEAMSCEMPPNLKWILGRHFIVVVSCHIYQDARAVFMATNQKRGIRHKFAFLSHISTACSRGFYTWTLKLKSKSTT